MAFQQRNCATHCPSANVEQDENLISIFFFPIGRGRIIRSFWLGPKVGIYDEDHNNEVDNLVDNNEDHVDNNEKLSII